MNAVSSRNTDHAASSGYLSLPGQSERRWMGSTVTGFLATGESTGGKFCLIDEVAKQGECVPLHKHDADDESFYVVEGEISIAVGADAPVLVSSGGFAHVPGGIVHGFRVESRKARYLILTTPRHGEFYKAISDGLQPDGSSPTATVEGGRVAAACKASGVEFVAPFPS